MQGIRRRIVHVTFYEIFAIALSALFPLEAPRALLLTLVIGMFGWPGIARVVAAETRVIVRQPYVVASRVMGARFFHVFRHQVLPNVASTLIVSMTLTFPEIILMESGLSFLGPPVIGVALYEAAEAGPFLLNAALLAVALWLAYAAGGA